MKTNRNHQFTFKGKPIIKLPKCGCGHWRKDHYGDGWCYGEGSGGKRTKGTSCGCTWYYPNDKWILAQTRKALKA